VTGGTLYLADTPEGIARAAQILRAGELVAFATETVYGLGADATNATAVAGIFAAKGRPRFNPLICHFHSASAAFAHVVADERARILTEAFWPGPLTLVLPRHSGSPIASLAAAGLTSLAVRVPSHPTAQALLAAVDRPVAAPSANRSGRISPTRSAHVRAELDGRIAAVLQSGPSAVGLESTVLDLTGPARLLRPGAISRAAIEQHIGPISHNSGADGSKEPLRGPGLLASHYAPTLPMRLQARRVGPHEALLGFGANVPAAALTYNLSERGDLLEAAANLFDHLRRLDDEATRQALTIIAVSPIPDDDIGLAINDRLSRAAAPR
jgi:L-threonylcarbamoyladenylate synthase